MSEEKQRNADLVKSILNFHGLNIDPKSISIDTPSEAEVYSPQVVEGKNYWYCPICDCEVDASRVTFEECHDFCNSKVISKSIVVEDKGEEFLPPDHGDVCWTKGAETFTRKEVFMLLHTQRSMIINDLKRYAGGDLTEMIYGVLNFPRKPDF